MRKFVFAAFFFAATGMYASADREIVDHLVQPRENIFRISLIYNSTIEDIVKANPGLIADKVKSGTTIKVPKDTKMRDAAFVAALMHGKKPPIQAEGYAQTMTKSQEEEVLNENPFMAPKKPQKSVEQMERESALENNVPQKAFKPAKEVKIAKNCETAVSVSGPANPSTTLVRANPLPISIFDSQMDQLITEQDPSLSNNITAVAAIGSVDNSKCIEEPVKTNINTSMDKIGTVDIHYADILRQLNQLIDGDQIASINLQIVMKDGTIKTISSPEEQKKVLSQLVSSTSGN
jgi:hypothetical protein